jgi:microcin C transport system substrate-binding protein
VWAPWGGSRLRDPESMWSSKYADDVATDNWCGLKNPEVDQLIEEQKTEMDLAKRDEIDKQLDAKLMELSPYVLMWEPPCQRILYWNRFGMPKYDFSKYGDEQDAIAYWWYDTSKAAALDNAMKQGVALPAAPADVHYGQ